MLNEEIVALCEQLYPDIAYRWPRSYLLREIPYCLRETAAYVIAANLPQGPMFDRFKALLQDYFVPISQGVMAAKQEREAERQRKEAEAQEKARLEEEKAERMKPGIPGTQPGV